GARSFVLEEGRVCLVRSGVDPAAEIHGRFPPEVVSFVVSSRHIEIEPTESGEACAVAREVQAVPVEGESRGVLLARRIDRGTKIVRRPPGVRRAGPLRNPYVSQARAASTLARHEIERVSAPGQERIGARK